MNRELREFWSILTFISVLSFGVSIMITQQNILKFGTPIFMLIYGVAGYSPSISAVYIVKKYQSNINIKLFMKSIISFKQSISSYLYSFLSPIVLWTIANLIYKLQTNTQPLLKSPIYSLIWLTPAMIIGGGLEEIGWRGYLLPKLMKRYSPTLSSIIIGVVWAIWHIPMWYVKGAPQQNFEYFPFALQCIAMSFILTPLYIRTKSIWLAIFVHSVGNACYFIFSGSLAHSYLTSGVTLITSILIYIVYMNILKIHYNEGIPN